MGKREGPKRKERVEGEREKGRKGEREKQVSREKESGVTYVNGYVVRVVTGKNVWKKGKERKMEPWAGCGVGKWVLSEDGFGFRQPMVKPTWPEKTVFEPSNAFFPLTASTFPQPLLSYLTKLTPLLFYYSKFVPIHLSSFCNRIFFLKKRIFLVL